MLIVVSILFVSFFFLSDSRVVHFKNSCTFPIDVEGSTPLGVICPNLASKGVCDWTIVEGFSGNFRRRNPDAGNANSIYGFPSATLAEFAFGDNRKVADWNYDWFDISIIPPGCPGTLLSYEACWCNNPNADGYDVGMKITPYKCTAQTRTCLGKKCDGAYQYPKDDSKTTTCTDISGDWEIEFCPAGSLVDLPSTATVTSQRAVCDGSTITPPPNTAPPPTNPPPATPPPTTPPCTSTTTYTVVSGDTCTIIATKFGVAQEKIYDIDDGNKPCITSRMWATDRMGICGGSTTVPAQPPPSQPPPSTGDCTTVNGVDYYGADISNSPAKDWGECCSICKSLSGCGAWTYAGGVCYAKKIAATANPVSAAGLISGSVTSATKPPPTTPPPTTPPPTTPPPTTPPPTTPPPTTPPPTSTTRPSRHTKFQNVGFDKGSYNRVTNMIPNSGTWNACDDPTSKCQKSPVSVSGPLAPFHEDQTVAFRGPMTIYHVAAYVPSGGVWNRVSDWTQGTLGSNLNWMGNAGDWSICHGSGQSFISADGRAAASAPVAFNGVLGNDINVNIMSNTACTSTPDDCPGFERGTAYVGWKGNACGEKMFAFQVQMTEDSSGSNNNNLPAIWMLNGQIVRTNQWGCNCRGMGSEGGCGEFDIVEAIPGRSALDLTSTLYSTIKEKSKGATTVFPRPTSSRTTYLTIFNGSGTGSISIMELPSFSFASSISHSDVASWTSSTTTETVVLPSPYSGTACSASIFASSPPPPTTTAPPPPPTTTAPPPPPTTTAPPPPPTTTASPPSTSNGCTIQKDTDYFGSDINNQPASSPDACCAYCKTLTGCAAWTLATGICYAKTSAALSNSKVSAGLTSGSVTPSTTPPPPPPNTGRCPKRGLAYSLGSGLDFAAVAPKLSWWYNWATNPTDTEKLYYKNYAMEFVPMVWGEDTIRTGAATVPSGSKYLLGFNEPNFKFQSNIAPDRVASLWPVVSQTAYKAHSSPKILSPAVNFCGPTADCVQTDPFIYLDQFFASCKGCQVDYIAVHWYACTADALKWYLNEFKKYGKPIWVTEFSCAQWDGSWKDNQQFQIDYMKQAVAILENEPMVFRYAWFSGRTTEIPYVNIFAGDGQLTDLGKQYLDQPCGPLTAEISEVSAVNLDHPSKDMVTVIGLSVGIAIAILLIVILIIILRKQKKILEVV